MVRLGKRRKVIQEVVGLIGQRDGSEARMNDEVGWIDIDSHDVRELRG